MKVVSKILKMLPVLFLSVALINTTPIYGSEDIELVINSVPITQGPKPIIKNGSTLVPIRVISEKLGAKVNWDSATKQIKINKSGINIEMTIGNPKVSINGVTEIALTAPIVHKDSTMLPLRFVGEALNCEVDWNSQARMVIVTEEGETKFVPPSPIVKVDVYGRKIRTTNLPSNAEWFPYIVEGLPNWAYEQTPFDDNYFGPSVNTNAPKGASKVAMFPKDVYNSSDSISRVMANHWEDLNEYMEAYVNVDYRTINQQNYADIMTKMTDIRTTSFKTEKELNDYYYRFSNYIVNNKVIIESEFQIMPETAWTTVGDQVGVLNFNVYMKMKPKQVLNGKTFDVPGTIQVSAYPKSVKKSTIKAGQELEGIATFTLLRTGMGEWKLFYSSTQPLTMLNPLIDLNNGVAPSKKSKDRLEKFSYSWSKDDKIFYTRYDRNARSSFSIE